MDIAVAKLLCGIRRIYIDKLNFHFTQFPFKLNNF